MTDSEQMAFLRRLFELAHSDKGFDLSDLIVIPEGDQVSVLMNCSDLFYWACVDTEPVTPDNISELERSVSDCERAVKFGGCSSPSLFAARMRKMRPQGAAYPEEPELWPLFDDCGPERDVGVGNPKPHPSKQPGSKQASKQNSPIA
jgi:hypothetical protein